MAQVSVLAKRNTWVDSSFGSFNKTARYEMGEKHACIFSVEGITCVAPNSPFSVRIGCAQVFRSHSHQLKTTSLKNDGGLLETVQFFIFLNCQIAPSQVLPCHLDSCFKFSED